MFLIITLKRIVISLKHPFVSNFWVSSQFRLALFFLFLHFSTFNFTEADEWLQHLKSKHKPRKPRASLHLIYKRLFTSRASASNFRTFSAPTQNNQPTLINEPATCLLTGRRSMTRWHRVKTEATTRFGKQEAAESRVQGRKDPLRRIRETELPLMNNSGKLHNNTHKTIMNLKGMKSCWVGLKPRRETGWTQLLSFITSLCLIRQRSRNERAFCFFLLCDRPLFTVQQKHFGD